MGFEYLNTSTILILLDIDFDYFYVSHMYTLLISIFFTFILNLFTIWKIARRQCVCFQFIFDKRFSCEFSLRN